MSKNRYPRCQWANSLCPSKAKQGPRSSGWYRYTHSSPATMNWESWEGSAKEEQHSAHPCVSSSTLGYSLMDSVEHWARGDKRAVNRSWKRQPIEQSHRLELPHNICRSLILQKGIFYIFSKMYFAQLIYCEKICSVTNWMTPFCCFLSSLSSL